MSEHTPGPWELHGDSVMPDPRRHIPDTMMGIATIQDHGNERPLFVRMANARLIVAAPDLLEALETARKELAELKDQIGFRGMTIDAIDMCDAALRKVRSAS